MVILETTVWVSCCKATGRVVWTFPISHSSSSNCIYVEPLEILRWWSRHMYENTVGIEVVSKTLYAVRVLFFCQQCVCVLCDWKSSCWRTLTVSVMVIVCQSLGGAAQQAMCVCQCVCACVFVCIYQQERVEQAPQCMSQQPSHQPLLIQPSRDVFVFLTVQCVCLHVWRRTLWLLLQ